MLKKLSIFALAFFAQQAIAQTDSSAEKKSYLDEIVVTSTRTENKLGNVAVPVSIINNKTISQAGSLRLKDILQEQAGLNLSNGFGVGIQMQGLNPDYTLILLNGEPLVGRTAGTLDLNRISTGNIKKIEIVKGPSSSLYGSEAMAGVINLITENTYKKKIEVSLRSGFGNAEEGWVTFINDEFKNYNANITAQTKINKTGLRYFADAFYTDAVAYRPHSSSKVLQPIWRLTQQLQINQPLSNKTTFDLSIRSCNDKIKQEFAVTNLGAMNNSYGKETNTDINVNPIITHTFNNRIKSTLRTYYTQYDGAQKLFFVNRPDSSYTDEFKQQFIRVENQTDFNRKKMRASIGAGYTIDNAQSTRYDNFENKKRNTILSIFAQHEWMPLKKLTIISGVRYDHNKVFAGALSPKLAIRFQPSKSIILNASIGRGFKAPDFRQLYLNFTNNAAGGYSVFGTIDAVKIINQMQSLGQLSEIKDDFNKLSLLEPEFSTGMNAGGTFLLRQNLQSNLNFFRNDIESLIDVRQVATKINGAQIFSYINIKNAYTQGAEIQVSWQPLRFIQISSGYQYLMTADKDEISKIKSGQVYTRNTDGTSRKLLMREYVGLPNRSKHMANFKITYENKHSFFATIRLLYKSKWYISDIDGNGLINSSDESAKSYSILNLSTGKAITNSTRITFGIDDIFNYKDLNYLPNLQGRMVYLTANFKINNH